MTLRLYNTLTRQLQEFTPLKPSHVTIYVCGPTVYDDPHIGHVRSAYSFEILRRYLAYRGYEVRFVRNVTDVDDKIIDKARQEMGSRVKDEGSRELQTKCQEISERYLNSYHDTLMRLGLTPPTEEPRAMQHIPAMQAMIQELLQRGAAYQAGGDVYFSVRQCAGYGKLSNRSVDALQSGARVEPGEAKRDPLDFALWKAAKPEEPSWESPWGQGRPGWHIECSVMSTKYLGDQFDIHGGGVDLVFPHHENEIAQAQAAGKPFARWWVHNGLVTINGQKMAKSLGNFVTVDAVLERYDADVLKLLFLSTHYRSPADFTWDKLEAAKNSFTRFDALLSRLNHLPKLSADATAAKPDPQIGRLRHQFEEAMDDDLNTPRALAVLYDDTASFGFQQLDQIGKTDVSTPNLHHLRNILFEFAEVLGLSMKQSMAQSITADAEVVPSKNYIQKKVEERNAARKVGDFQTADRLRRQLASEGIILEDTPQGTVWRHKR